MKCRKGKNRRVRKSKEFPSYLPKKSGIIEVPIELLPDFQLNPNKALRDLASIPTEAISPFFGNLANHWDNFLLSAERNIYNSQFGRFRKGFPICTDELPRYIHIDLAVNKDAAGIAMSFVKDYVPVERVNEQSETQIYTMPYVVFELTGRLVAPKNGEIQIDTLMDIVVKLRDDYNYDIQLVTFDRYQSVSSIQRLRDMGFIVGSLSLDKTANVCKINYDKQYFIEKINTDKNYVAPFEMLKQGIMENRVEIPRVFPRDAMLVDEERTWSEEFEFNGLEYDAIKNQVIKSNHATDDWVQAVAGSYCNAVVNEMDIAFTEITEQEKVAMALEVAKDENDPYSMYSQEDNPYENYSIGVLDDRITKTKKN